MGVVEKMRRDMELREAELRVKTAVTLICSEVVVEERGDSERCWEKMRRRGPSGKVWATLYRCPPTSTGARRFFRLPPHIKPRVSYSILCKLVSLSCALRLPNELAGSIERSITRANFIIDWSWPRRPLSPHHNGVISHHISRAHEQRATFTLKHTERDDGCVGRREWSWDHLSLPTFVRIFTGPFAHFPQRGAIAGLLRTCGCETT